MLVSECSHLFHIRPFPNVTTMYWWNIKIIIMIKKKNQSIHNFVHHLPSWIALSFSTTNTVASTVCSNHLRVQRSPATHIMLWFPLVILREKKLKLDTRICSHYRPKDSSYYIAPKVILPNSNSTCFKFSVLSLGIKVLVAFNIVLTVQW